MVGFGLRYSTFFRVSKFGIRASFVLFETSWIGLLRDISDRGLDGVGAGATRTGFWRQEQTSGGNHGQPAAAANPLELHSFVRFKIPLPMVVVPKEYTIL